MKTELKVVMFTDQVMSTANTLRRTNSQIAQISAEQDDLTSEVLRLTQGVLLKDTGDGCFAQFPGVLQAVQAGVLLQQRIAARNILQQDELLHFTLHVAIDVGELVVLTNGDLRGEAANRCARLCSLCPPGDVYLSDVAALMLKSSEVEVEQLPPKKLKGLGGLTKLYRVKRLRLKSISPPNPFIWRGGITNAADFFGREEEQRTLQAYVRGKQNCQIVGPRRIGKTSLLMHFQRTMPAWAYHETIVAFVDLQDPRCYALGSFLSLVARQFEWDTPPSNLIDFAESAEKMLRHDVRPVLCVDEFEEFGKRPLEFTDEFFLTLRSCSQQGLSIVTASQRQLSEITRKGDSSSPFYNTFPLLRLGTFSQGEALNFVRQQRVGSPPFNHDQEIAIIEFAKGHPLALQVACFHVVDAITNGKSLTSALKKADDDMRAHC